MVLGQGHLLRSLYHFSLKIRLNLSVAQNPLVVSVAQILLVMSVKYFQLTESQIPLVVSVEHFSFFVSVEYFYLVESVSCSSPIWDNLPSGHHRYLLKGLNLGYMYWGQKHSFE